MRSPQGMSTMTVPAESNVRDKEGDHAWYTGVDLQWRSPPPTHSNGNGMNGGHGTVGTNGSVSYGMNGTSGANGSRKRAWEEVATPVHENAPSANWSNGFEFQRHTPPFDAATNYSSRNGASSTTLDNAEDDVEEIPRTKMQTGCIPCLIKGIKCDPSNPDCRSTAISDDWAINAGTRPGEDEDGVFYPDSLTLFRPDTKWRRSWRERHCLNFFVNFSAPQMAGFFDSAFWQRMVIQTSYHEPAIRHAITAIGALHECIMQRAFADDKQKAKAMEFALNQCNKAIACLTAEEGYEQDPNRRRIPSSRLALTTCVLFTCFEAMQGRCDSAVNHALQGRRLMQSTGRAAITSMSPAEEDDIEQMRPLVERLEVQATALLDKGRRPEIDTSGQTPPLPPIDYIFSLEHAHNTLHTALNSVMRFMQGFHPTAPRDHIAVTMAEKYLRYAPWFSQWEQAFTAFLSDQRDYMSNMDLKRAMVLKANHLVGTMLASVDQSAGPVAYDAYEAEFRAIVDLAREVLASFSCPPLPTLSGPNSGTPYLSFSLWVTDPLWMAISRCRNPTIRQSAFTLLSRNPRQEGIWHAGPQLPNSSQYMRRVETGSSGRPAESVRGPDPPSNGADRLKIVRHERDQDDPTNSPNDNRSGSEWVKLRNQVDEWTEESNQLVQSEWLARGGNNRPTVRYETHCRGRCCIPTLEEIRPDRQDPGDLLVIAEDSPAKSGTAWTVASSQHSASPPTATQHADSGSCMCSPACACRS
ncbi:hypothetical protein CKM354_001167800 [Cercospora kikuchii]|uniref:Zn(2)-C6 fungal-type domain-containing protein n=1 Tax=Cercospora kikuchii TaxID=84275 RepID=A0A9P3CTI7_9PEZI|nr:uncharacterized protein CKM354_001167800 [Cercospora kikuchii]GIZ48626.1 hypothetical protein CKM354_001167800 [Cercospora kikuchii]